MKYTLMSHTSLLNLYSVDFTWNVEITILFQNKECSTQPKKNYLLNWFRRKQNKLFSRFHFSGLGAIWVVISSAMKKQMSIFQQRNSMHSVSVKWCIDESRWRSCWKHTLFHIELIRTVPFVPSKTHFVTKTR